MKKLPKMYDEFGGIVRDYRVAVCNLPEADLEALFFKMVEDGRRAHWQADSNWVAWK